MLVLEQRLSFRQVGRGVVIQARLLHGLETNGWRMRFSPLRTEVEIDADPETYRELARRLRAANVVVRPGRSRLNVTPKAIPSPILSSKPVISPAVLTTNNQMKPLYCQDGGDVKAGSPCRSPGAILPDLPQPADDPDKSAGLSRDATAPETQAWLTRHRFTQHLSTFTNFSGADLLRLTRDDIIQICGLADGIRLFNALHAKRIEPRLTVFVCPSGCTVYSALYLHACRAAELLHKLRALLPPAAEEFETVLISGPNGAPVRITDELVRHLPDKSTYQLERLEEDTLLLRPSGN